MSYLTLQRLTKTYKTNGREMTVLDRLSLEVDKGQLLVLLGPSGCGKTTILRMVAGLESPSLGSVRVNGIPIQGPGRDRTLVFQEGSLFPWLTAADNVAFGLRAMGVPRRERLARAGRLLSRLGLEDYGQLYPHQLSCGMRQRVAIARALAVDPDVLLLDEPFASVDALTRAQLQEELLGIWHRYQKTILFVTHSVHEAVLLADRIAILTDRPSGLVICQTIDIPRPRRDQPRLVAEWERCVSSEIARPVRAY